MQSMSTSEEALTDLFKKGAAALKDSGDQPYSEKVKDWGMIGVGNLLPPSSPSSTPNPPKEGSARPPQIRAA